MKKVFGFTLKEAMKGKSFKIASFGVAIALFLLPIIILSIAAVSADRPEKKDKKDSNKLKTVYVVNETSYDYLDFSQLKGIKVVTSDQTKEKLRKNLKKNEAVVLISIKKNQSLSLEMELSEDSDVDEDEGYDCLTEMETVIRKQKLIHSQISETSLAVVMAPVETEFATVGTEAEGIFTTLVKFFIPLILIMTLYFMAIVYGQSIAKSVSAEKTSKLMETLLLCVKPYDLISGKVLAMSILGLMQFLMWILGLTGGLITGKYVADLLNPKFDNPITMVWNGLRALRGGIAFSMPAILIAILAFSIGFVFFCVLAALIASRISKAEDLSQGMGSYQLIVVVGFLGSYFPVIQGKTSILTVVRWFPLTSAFALSSDILVGNVSLLMGSMMLLVLILTMIILVAFTGRMYRNQVFYKR